MKLLSILIPTTPDRGETLIRLKNELYRQIHELKLEEQVDVDILETPLSKAHPTITAYTTGSKRNALVSNSQGKYYAFIDSDDMPSPNYLELIMPGIYKDVDCCSLVGSIYFNGKKGKPFHHSIQYKEAWEDDKTYFRPINHLNCVKKELVLPFLFQEKNFGEDMCWAMDVSNAGVLKNEYEINEVLYHYFVGEPKKEIV